MAVLLYVGSMLTSVLSFIMLMFLTFAEEDSEIFKYYGEKEAIICVVIAFVFMILAYLVDRR
jgi:Kef-type K+ transport system membrane component KefB